MIPHTRSYPPPRSVPVTATRGGGHYVYRGNQPWTPPKNKETK